MKSYYLRELAFGYNDECMYPIESFVKLTTKFNTREEAEHEFLKLQQSKYSGIMLEDWEGISPTSTNDRALWERLDKFCQTNFGKPFLVNVDWTEEKMPDRVMTLPNNISLELTKELLEITGLKHYEIIEVVESEPCYYGLYINNNYGLKEHWYSESIAKYEESTGYQSKQIPRAFKSKETVINENSS
ncbi:MAG: hypothetical protein AAGK97_08660, partial [Bacteroidota bacterium]